MAELTQKVPFKFEMALDSIESSEVKDEGKSYYLQGIASDNLPDKQNQRFSKGYLKTMVDLGFSIFSKIRIWFMFKVL